MMPNGFAGKKWILIQVCCLLLAAALPEDLYGQLPPRPLIVNAAQDLAFGAFYQGATGGTVTVSPAGSRSSTGDVVLLFGGFTFSAARFRIIGNQGTLITLMTGPDVILYGSNGGSMILHTGGTIPVSPFVLTLSHPVPTDLWVGGTLTVGSPAANPPGSYSGSFTIIFNQQ